MKKVVLLIVLLLTLVGCAAEEGSSSTKYEVQVKDMKGNVKTYTNVSFVWHHDGYATIDLADGSEIAVGWPNIIVYEK